MKNFITLTECAVDSRTRLSEYCPQKIIVNINYIVSVEPFINMAGHRYDGLANAIVTTTTKTFFVEQTAEQINELINVISTQQQNEGAL